jgi:integrase
VIDPGLVTHKEATEFLSSLYAASCSPHTVRAYAGRVAAFLTWCQADGVEWHTVALSDMARFKHNLESSPSALGRYRSGSTVNAILTAVCEFLRFCARTGLIAAIVAERLSEPRFLRFTPPGFDPGESGQFRLVRARSIKARSETPFPEALTPEQSEVVTSACYRPRDRFVVVLLRDTGLRAGEALGLRREDMHLLPDSEPLAAKSSVPMFMCAAGRTRTGRSPSPASPAWCRRVSTCSRPTATTGPSALRFSATIRATW